MNWYLQALKNYANFSGRARRKELWFFFLFNIIIAIVLGLVEAIVRGSSEGTLVLASLYQLFVLIPSLSVQIRRLHDTGRSGWWILLNLLPMIGSIVLLVFYFMDSQPGENKWGLNPKQNEMLSYSS